MKRFASWLLLAAVAVAPRTTAQDTEQLLLSGSGHGDTVDWEFLVTDGRRSGEWTTIPVPSQWEQQGFGAYNYGHDAKKSREQGRYRTRFRLPESWQDRAVDLVFEGVMTDAEVRLNGRSAGPVHRGAFYRFRYDVSELLRPAADNVLEVTVSKHSADATVNRAEREADYWVFGGIYRPVFLEARPAESIGQVKIDARHDGRAAIFVETRGLKSPAQIRARFETLDGAAVDAPLVIAADASGEAVRLSTRIDRPRTWSAERPYLYRLVVELERAGQRLHRHVERFGFRTVEVRRQGLFVNGRRVRLKGVNRHAFWPPSGRTLNRDLDFRDAELIKSMNMNAVRASHYPPDASFLEACDTLGLYVIDELAGWHDAYGTRIGRQLIQEMVDRDVNHPSVILWANGNEGGWNTALDEVFAEHDPQRRPVIHPHAFFGGIDAQHYLSWQELESSLDPASLRNRWRELVGELPPVLPTELLHGLYDGGSGAGLEDYWRRLRDSPRGAGLFLWSFIDEAVERSDRGGALDTDGNHAPDGILGPYRELSGNFYAVREVLSPVRLAGERFTGAVAIENHFDEIDLAQCTFDWSLIDLPGPGEAAPADLLASGTLGGPAVPPGGRGELRLPAGTAWRSADAVRLTARDPARRELLTWTLPTRDLRADLAGLATAEGAPVTVDTGGERLILRAGAAAAELDLASGELVALSHAGRRLAFSRGPLPADERQAGPAANPASALRHRRDGDSVVVETAEEPGPSTRWTFFPSGWLRLEYEYDASGRREFFGIRFDLRQPRIERFRWLGGGPARVWKNRLAGASLGVWEKAAAGATAASSPHEPKLAGYYARVLWGRLATPAGDLLLAIESPDLFLGVSSPEFPDDARDARAPVPGGGFSLLHGISAIGTKFHPARDLGPASQPNEASGRYRGTIWMRSAPAAESGVAETP